LPTTSQPSLPLSCFRGHLSSGPTVRAQTWGYGGRAAIHILGFRWYGIIGQLNINWGQLCCPGFSGAWIEGSHRPQVVGWCVLTGAVWALAVNSSVYYIWIGGFAILAWLVVGLSVVESAGGAILGSAGHDPACGGHIEPPGRYQILASQRGCRRSSLHNLRSECPGAASTASDPIPVPSVLTAIARSIYQGPAGSEAGMANLGLLACLCALAGLTAAWRAKAWRPVLLLGSVG